MTPTKMSHCAYDTHYHIVFPVKYRKALLSTEITKHLEHIARDIEERFPIEFESIWYDQDHIHILCSFSPTKYKWWEVIWIFKSITAKELFKKFPELKKDLWWGEFWSDGYYFATVWERWWWDVVKRYVENQGKTRWSDLQLKLIF